jgi:hypothetical protein
MSNDIINETLFQSLNDELPYKKVVSEKGISQLKYEYFNNNIYETKTCPISGEDFEHDQLIVILPCEHIFSEVPIMKWLTKENASCPICRFQLESKEIRTEEPNSNTLPTSLPTLPSLESDFTSFEILVNAAQRYYDQIEQEQLQLAIVSSLQS